MHRVYETRGDEQVAVWRCNCFYYSKLGLPCWHEIQACIEERTNLIPQINPFWLKNSKLAQKKDCNINEHDVKYWNEDSAKIYHEDKEGRNEKIEQTSAQKKDGNNSQTNQPNNVLYNVKINQNPS